MEANSDWTCNQFSIALGEEELPELLRRVASHIESLPGFRLLNGVLDTHDNEVIASVYYYGVDPKIEEYLE